MVVIPRAGDVLIVVPPFHGIERPSLGVHNLQAIAARDGFRVNILYSNLYLAKIIGAQRYTELSYMPYGRFVWDQLFHEAVFGAPCQLPDDIKDLERPINDWLGTLTSAIIAAQYPIVGCTAAFSCLSSVAILAAVKRLQRSVITIIGGAHCDGEMAKGIMELPATADLIFSGESDHTFPQFLREWRNGKVAAGPVIYSPPVENLDDIPLPNYEEYFAQALECLGSEFLQSDEISLTYETSRGCWWGQKHHCTFCGVNGSHIGYRRKSPQKVIDDLRALSNHKYTNKIQMTDNIMPWEYFETLLPRMAREQLGLEIFYEQKANLTLRHVLLLKFAGIVRIQPGVESFSDFLLKRMKKGVSARQNIALLRYALAAKVRLDWNVLVGVPGDSSQEYEKMLEWLPLLHHLQPPISVFNVNLDRGSPYFKDPALYGIRNLRPNRRYANLFRQEALVHKLAFHFSGDYDSVLSSAPEVVLAVRDAVKKWRVSWHADNTRPKLSIAQVSADRYMLLDTRGLLGLPAIQFIDIVKARAALAESTEVTPAVEWGLKSKVCVEHDGRFIPLATASPRLMAMFIDQYSKREPEKNSRDGGRVPGHLKRNKLGDVETTW